MCAAHQHHSFETNDGSGRSAGGVEQSRFDEYRTSQVPPTSSSLSLDNNFSGKRDIQLVRGDLVLTQLPDNQQRDAMEVFTATAMMRSYAPSAWRGLSNLEGLGDALKSLSPDQIETVARVLDGHDGWKVNRENGVIKSFNWRSPQGNNADADPNKPDISLSIIGGKIVVEKFGRYPEKYETQSKGPTW